MATGAGGSAYLPVVDAIAQCHHFSRRSLGKWRTGSACVYIRSFWWFGGSFNDVTGGSRSARTWCSHRASISGTALIDDAVNPSANIIGNVERAIRPNCDARGTMRGALGSFYRARKTVGEDFAIA